MWPPSAVITIWTASSEFVTYRLGEQRRFRRVCASAQSRQNLRCSLIQAVSQEEPSDTKPDPWPLWMAGHAQLKFVMTECSKTQIRLTGLIWHWSAWSKWTCECLSLIWLYCWHMSGSSNSAMCFQEFKGAVLNFQSIFFAFLFEKFCFLYTYGTITENFNHACFKKKNQSVHMQHGKSTFLLWRQHLRMRMC